MDSEKVEEIKKALEVYCKENKGITILRGREIQAIPYADILTLINEFESENERLLNEKWDKEDDLDNYHEENKQLKDRIAELEKEKEETMKAWFEDREGVFLNGVREGELKCYKQLKQFAERLKEKYGKSCSEYYPILIEITSDDIDELCRKYMEELL